MEYKELYIWSRSQARQSGETKLWHESHNENCRCARAIDVAISSHYKDNSLNNIGAKKILHDYGFERVNFVLANMVQLNQHDGRYSPENKQWAMGVRVPYDDKHDRDRFTLNAHPGLINVFINQVRAEWNALGLYDDKHCYDNSRKELNYSGQVVVLDPTIFKDEYKKPENQLFYAKFGNGCRPDALGTKVYGQCLHSGRECYYRRSEILGVMKLELVPEWAREKVMEITFKAEEKELKAEEQAKDESEDESEEESETVGQIQT